jgi:glucokinase
MSYDNDARVVLTLDAGGTNLVFSAIRGHQEVVQPITLPTYGDDLPACLANVERGFSEVGAKAPQPPVAISFAFPGPADYPRGIIGDLGNLPAFRGGVALGPMLEDKFGIPTFINNDGDLFALGEAIAGLLPHVNGLLAQAGSPLRYRNLFGATFGTGFGGGIARDGQLFLGDSGVAAEIWLMRHKLERNANVEEGVSIRAVRRVYAQRAGIPFDAAPEPKEIYAIGMGQAPGNAAAARAAFALLGEVAGDALANASTLIDGLIVIGGGLSAAHALFLPALLSEMNSTFTTLGGATISRLEVKAFNLEDAGELRRFLDGAKREICVPGSNRKVAYDPLQRIGVGISRLGTSRATAVGAYAFALSALDRGAAEG